MINNDINNNNNNNINNYYNNVKSKLLYKRCVICGYRTKSVEDIDN